MPLYAKTIMMQNTTKRTKNANNVANAAMESVMRPKCVETEKINANKVSAKPHQ